MLEVCDLVVRYGHHRALDGVSVKVAKGEICVILGANGAGKSSLLKAIAGMIRSEPGSRVTMNGKPISGMKAHRVVEEGIALVPEGRGIFGDLTVAENLQLGAFALRARGQQADRLRQIYELFPRLEERKRQIARTMSGGEQQMVAIGRALMSKPDILMLDEPSLGLSPILTKELFRSLQAIAQTGVGILLVEQNAKQSLKIAERGYLIENGLITGENSAAALASDPAVVNAYLGGGKTQDKKPSRVGGMMLPNGFSLPLGLGAMGRFMGALAGRAGAIQQAFVRLVRGHSAVPSAFVGRYDPAEDARAWEKLALDPFGRGERPRHKEVTTMVSSDARKIAGGAAALAGQASERLQRHVRAARLSSKRPGAFAAGQSQADAGPQRGAEANTPAPAVAPGRDHPSRPQTIDARGLADRAAARLADHMRRQRAARGHRTSAPNPTARDGGGPAENPEARRPGEPAPRLLDAAALSEAAAERLASHLRAQRAARGLSSTRPNAPAAPAPEDRRRPHTEAAAANGASPSPMLGHNSAGFVIDEEAEPGPAGRSSGGLDFSALVARATARQAEHVAAARRKSLTAFRYTPSGNDNQQH